MVQALVDENADSFHVLRHLGDDRARGFQSDVARALRIKDKTQRVRARIGGGERVVEVCHSADLDPSHKKQLSVAGSRQNLKAYDLLTTDHRPLTTAFHQLRQRLA